MSISNGSGKLCDQLNSEEDKANLFNAQTAQEELIKKEVEVQPLVGGKEQVASVSAEYTQEDSPEFLERAKELESRFGYIRRVRGDGNCFYRAVAFAQLEKLLTRSEQLTKFVEEATCWKGRLLKLGFPQMTTEDFCEVFVDSVKEVGSMKSVKQLEDLFNDQGRSDYMVVFMRLVTSGLLQEQEERFGGFIEGGKAVKEYCQTQVDPMYTECDHLCICALTEALDIPLRIEYCDRSHAPVGGYHHDFCSAKPGATDEQLCFLYRPGHYDILYPK